MCDNAYNQSDSADLESEGRVMSNVINMSGGAADLQSKTVNPSTSQQVVRPDTGKDGLSQVTVNAIKLQSKSVGMSRMGGSTAVYPDSDYAGLSQVAINPMLQLQDAIFTPTVSIHSDGHLYITIPSPYNVGNLITFLLSFVDSGTNQIIQVFSGIYSPWTRYVGGWGLGCLLGWNFKTPLVNVDGNTIYTSQYSLSGVSWKFESCFGVAYLPQE